MIEIIKRNYWSLDTLHPEPSALLIPTPKFSDFIRGKPEAELLTIHLKPRLFVEIKERLPEFY